MAADESLTGEQIYRSHCSRCHGASGEGTNDHHPEPLIGDRSVAELAKLIEKTMPEDAPEKCVGEDAKKVAVYIYDSFYSPLAQMRNQPARIELSRLTVRQYENALADLMGSFRSANAWGDTRGLKGGYFRAKFADRALERVDPTIQFNFGTSSPAPDRLDALDFSIRWSGSLLAPETGDYEFIVRTDHAARLFLWTNNNRQPVIDAWVKSRTENEHRVSIRLLGGRVYPLQLEFAKGWMGGKSDFEQQNEPASIALEWKPPHGVVETIPQRFLSPEGSPEAFVVHAPFPPDDRSTGYERGTSISKAWDQATTDGAIEVADYVNSRLDELIGNDETASDRTEKLRDFCYRFAERAFRGPLSDEQKRWYVDRWFNESNHHEVAVTRVVLLVLKSPQFLYREPGEMNADPYHVAARLSFGLWDSLPDQELLCAAAAGELATPEQVMKHAERMMTDLRTRAKIQEFFRQWFKIDRPTDFVKDSQRYPDFNNRVAADLRASLELFVESVVWSEHSDFRQLLLADVVPMNGRLAKFYGVNLAEDAPFQNVTFEPERRAGVLTHPYLLTRFAYPQATSPIHRGVFIVRGLLGRALRPPPDAMTPLPPEAQPELTTRQRVALQTQSASCMTCHELINPPGFALEHFDAVGRFRTEENGKPIDAAGIYVTRSGEAAHFNGVREFAKFLAENEETHAAFVEQLFHYLVKQPIRAYGPERLDELRKSFAQNQCNIRKLVTEIVTTSAIPPKQQKPSTGS